MRSLCDCSVTLCALQVKRCYPSTVCGVVYLSALHTIRVEALYKSTTFFKLFTRALRFFSPIEHCELVNMAVVCRGVRILKIATRCHSAPAKPITVIMLKVYRFLYPLILTRFYTHNHRCIGFISCSLPFRQKCTWHFKSPH